MASVIYSPRDIYEQEFKTSLRGFDKVEVDEFLDNVISDYELFLAEIKKLKQENADLKSRVQELEDELASVETTPAVDITTVPLYGASQFTEAPAVEEEVVEEPVEEIVPEPTVPYVSNYDLLRRISRLELEVFGKKIEE
jgi:DivIVA domain-containing protein